MNPLRLVLLSLASLGPGLMAAPPPAASGDSPLRIIRTEIPAFPRAAEALGLRRGEARLAILIDAAGRMPDHLVIGYSHHFFAEAATAAIEAWRFEPMRIHGLPRAGVVVLKFTFATEGPVLIDNLTGDGQTESFFRMIQSNPGGFSACLPHDLDRIPLPTRMVRPVYPTKPDRPTRPGRATVKFYIDDQGRVRLPRISSKVYAANDELGGWAMADAAVAAVTQWRFEPPLSNGKPTVVLVEQDFNFGPATP